MSVQQSHGVANVAQLAEFDEIIDVRSPAEYAEDRLPGAISCPVLDDQQRAHVGTLYKQASPFAAKKIGAVLVARNIAGHIEQKFLGQPRDWRPLVYCWRSGAFTHILRQIGWDAQRLEGGYKAWRNHVIAQLALLPQGFRYRVVSGTTGSGKSRRIGSVQLPNELLDRIRVAPSLCIEASTNARVEFLLRDYDYLLTDPRWLIEKLGLLRGLQSNETLARWTELVELGEFPALVSELLELRYDPLYRHSQSKNFTGFDNAIRLATDDLSVSGIQRLAQKVLAGA